MLQAEAFWQYSLQTYAQEDVKKQCLLLQTDNNANVNMILLCGFLTENDYFVSAEILASLNQRIENIDQQLRALRIKRNSCKTQQLELYRTLLAEELVLEKHQQATMIAALNEFGTNTSQFGTEFIDQNKDNFISYHKSLKTSGERTVKDIMKAKDLILNG